MRVLYISDVYFPRVNGVSTSIMTFRADLTACGIETHLVAPLYGEATNADAGDAGILRVESSPVPRDPEDRRMHRTALRNALDSLQSESFDLVHIHTPFVAHYAGRRFARRMRIPCIATYHTFFEEYLHHYLPAMPRSAGRWLARTFTQSQCRDLDALIAPSAMVREKLREYGVTTPVHVVPTGVPAGRFKQGDGARFRANIGVTADRPLVLYVGRVALEKNIEFLVQMFASVLKRIPSAVLVIAGEGPAHAALRMLVGELQLSESVRFAGYLDRDTALLDCYAAADTFVFASRTETQGLVLLEAMAQGTPIVSTAALGTRSILAAGRGAVVVPEHQEFFAKAVADLLADPSRRRELSAQGRAYAMEWSSVEMAQNLASVYHEVAQSSSIATAG